MSFQLLGPLDVWCLVCLPLQTSRISFLSDQETSQWASCDSVWVLQGNISSQAFRSQRRSLGDPWCQWCSSDLVLGLKLLQYLFCRKSFAFEVMPVLVVSVLHVCAWGIVGQTQVIGTCWFCFLQLSMFWEQTPRATLCPNVSVLSLPGLNRNYPRLRDVFFFAGKEISSSAVPASEPDRSNQPRGPEDSDSSMADARPPMRTNYMERLLDNNVWQCPRCTLINEDFQECGACGFLQPDMLQPLTMETMEGVTQAAASSTQDGQHVS